MLASVTCFIIQPPSTQRHSWVLTLLCLHFQHVVCYCSLSYLFIELIDFKQILSHLHLGRYIICTISVTSACVGSVGWLFSQFVDKRKHEHADLRKPLKGLLNHQENCNSYSNIMFCCKIHTVGFIWMLPFQIKVCHSLWKRCYFSSG